MPSDDPQCPVCDGSETTTLHDESYHPVSKAATVDFTTTYRDLRVRCDSCGVLFDPRVKNVE